jgi:seryl-tRNA synthetase
MLDIKLIRENPKIVKESEKKRGKDPKVVDGLLKLDEQWRKAKFQEDKIRSGRNKISEEINKAKKNKDEKKAKELIKKAKEIPEKLSKQQEKTEKLGQDIKQVMLKLSNILAEDVPPGKDENDNKELKKWGKIPKFDFKIKGHADIVEDLDIADVERGARAAGARFYYLKNELVLLNQALQKFALDFLMKKGFSAIQTPYMLNRFSVGGAVNLTDFEETIYKIQDEDLYLIGTSEHALAALHQNEMLDLNKPRKYAGLSSCFRKEAGSHGKDTKGIFRVHRFEKIEQFVYCKPEDEDKVFNEIINNQEEIFKLLEIPFRVVYLSTGDTGGSMAKTYDLEGWFPAQNKYRELGSTSSARTFQSRKLNTKYSADKGERKHCYTINGTAMTVQRTMCCIIENNQTKTGSIKIPKVLWKYTGFKEIKAKK